MSAIVVIPARYQSTRFPGKPLALLRGIPVIEHVYRNSSAARFAEDVIVATDSRAILERVKSFGGKALMTSESHQSGTDRIAEIARSLNYDIIVNVQGDEPLIQPGMIDDVISVLDDSRASIGTLAVAIKDQREIIDPNVVKVVFDSEWFAFYFSRAPIPYHRDAWKMMGTEHETGKKVLKGIFELSSHLFLNEFEKVPALDSFQCYKHIGIYSYRRDILMQLSEMPPTRLERIERLEQLRALENNITIKVKEAFAETFGVDTPEDLERIEKCLNSSS